MAPSLCAQGSTSANGAEYLAPDEWMATVAYRYFHSFRDFRGSKAIPFPSPKEIYADNHVHTFDVSVMYAVTKRLSLTLGVPIPWGSRTSYYEHDGVSRHTMRTGGVGDLRLMGSFWLLDPDTHPDQNISVGLGVKAPTGEHRAKDYSYRANGRVLRPVDPAIQRGDGGWGTLLAVQAFQKVFTDTSIYLQGTYLINPREMNGTQTPFGDIPALTGGDIGYTINSVPDQFVARLGLTHTIWPEQGLSATLGTRVEGVPVRDLLGGSQGYRIPGFAVSVEPGLAIALGKNFFELNVPVAVYRHASKTRRQAHEQSYWGDCDVRRFPDHCQLLAPVLMGQQGGASGTNFTIVRRLSPCGSRPVLGDSQKMTRLPRTSDGTGLDGGDGSIAGRV